MAAMCACLPEQWLLSTDSLGKPASKQICLQTAWQISIFCFVRNFSSFFSPSSRRNKNSLSLVNMFVPPTKIQAGEEALTRKKQRSHSNQLKFCHLEIPEVLSATSILSNCRAVPLSQPSFPQLMITEYFCAEKEQSTEKISYSQSSCRIHCCFFFFNKG